jgi:hypothetical protein
MMQKSRKKTLPTLIIRFISEFGLALGFILTARLELNIGSRHSALCKGEFYHYAQSDHFSTPSLQNKYDNDASYIVDQANRLCLFKTLHASNLMRHATFME